VTAGAASGGGPAPGTAPEAAVRAGDTPPSGGSVRESLE
jgi:hypothetical protein